MIGALRVRGILRWLSACVIGAAVFVPAGAQTQSASPAPVPPTLEERLPLELFLADSIVPQDTHETMLTTGAWHDVGGRATSNRLTQKVEWGFSDQWQVSAFWTVVNRVPAANVVNTGVGDLELETRYSWRAAPADRTHVALSVNLGLPTGAAARDLGEGLETTEVAVLLSHEPNHTRLQFFTTAGVEVVTHVAASAAADHSRDALFANSGASLGLWRGWAVLEAAVSNDRWNGGTDNSVTITPGYVLRFAPRGEIAFGAPLGATASASRWGAIVKFTFEVGGK